MGRRNPMVGINIEEILNGGNNRKMFSSRRISGRNKMGPRWRAGYKRTEYSGGTYIRYDWKTGLPLHQNERPPY